MKVHEAGGGQSPPPASWYTRIHMATKKKPIVIGNWKMNPRTSSDGIALAKAVILGIKKISNVSVVIAPPTLYLSAVQKVTQKSHVALGVQHIHPGPVGAFTGDVSPAQVMEYGASYAIVGHSERRAIGMTDSMVNEAVLMLLKSKMIPIICVGERVRDADATFYRQIENQIKAALANVPATRYKDIIIAYEPIWAIGTGATATAADVLEMKLFIQKVLTEIIGRAGAHAATIIYGGSVKPDTAPVLYRDGAVDGFLVGGASLIAKDFLAIISAVANS